MWSGHRLEPKNHANCEAERRYAHTYSLAELQAAICARLRMTATAPLASTASATAMREGVRARAGVPRLENVRKDTEILINANKTYINLTSPSVAVGSDFVSSSSRALANIANQFRFRIFCALFI